MEEVKKKEVKTGKNFYLSILRLLREGVRPSHLNEQGLEAGSICSILSISKQSLNYYLSTLKRLGFIRKQGYGAWEILREISDKEVQKEVKKRSKNDSSRGMRADFNRPVTNLHALEIKFPILSGTIQDQDWEIKNKLNHWVPSYKGLEILGGLTVRNNNNKSISVFAKTRNLRSLDEVDNLAFKIRAFIHEYFKNKHDVVLDVFDCEVKNINLATEDRHGKEMNRKGEKFELNLNKKSEKIFEKDNLDAKAWIDGSPFQFSAESNDKEWKRCYLQMPFSIAGLSNSMPAIKEYTKQIKLHMAVQKQQLKTMKKMQKYLDILNQQKKSQ